MGWIEDPFIYWLSSPITCVWPCGLLTHIHLWVSSAWLLGGLRFRNRKWKCESFNRVQLFNAWECIWPGSSVHGDSPGKNTGVGCHSLFQGIFLAQGSNLGFLHCRQILYHLSHKGSIWDHLGWRQRIQNKSKPSYFCHEGRQNLQRGDNLYSLATLRSESGDI